MFKCAVIEPAPRSFYAPNGLFTDVELAQMGATMLGDRIQRPGCTSPPQRVTTGPLCLLYWGNGLPEPDIIESAWYPKDQSAFDASPATYRVGWKRDRNNYLSYRLESGSFVTVRWPVRFQDIQFCNVVSDVVAA